MSLNNAMKQSCDTYFYEVARLLGVDKLKITAKKFGLGEKVLGEYFDNEKKGLFPNTKWKKNNLGRGWVLGETLITGIGQGYTQTTPLQLCLMTAQIANGGYSIKPKIIVNNNPLNFKEVKKSIKGQNLLNINTKLVKNPKNLRIVHELFLNFLGF